MIREHLVGNTTISAKHRATCHCGSVEFEPDLPDGIVDPRRCDFRYAGAKARLWRRFRYRESGSLRGRRS
jgi:hypothetical protein